MSQVDDAARRIFADFAAVPALQMDFCQAKRRWNLPDDLRDRAFSTVMGAGYLARTLDGRYRRRHPERRGGRATRPLRTV